MTHDDATSAKLADLCITFSSFNEENQDHVLAFLHALSQAQSELELGPIHTCIRQPNKYTPPESSSD